MENNSNSKLITDEEEIVLADTKPVTEQVLTKSTTLLTTEPITFGDNGGIAPMCLGEDNSGSNADFPTYEINLKTPVTKYVQCAAYFKFKTNAASIHPDGLSGRYSIHIFADYDVVAYLYKGSKLIAQRWDESTAFPLISSVRLDYNAIYELKVAFLNNNVGNITVLVDYSELSLAPTVPPIVTPKIENAQNIATENTFADPVDVFTGAHTIKNDIMNLFGGQNITFSLNYNSSNLCCGDVGYGWYHNYEKKIEIINGVTCVYSNPSQFNEYTHNSDGTYTCSSPGKNGYVLTVINGGYLLDCNKDHKEYYDTNGRLIKIVNHNGFETEICHENNLVTITDKVCDKSIYLEIDNFKIVKVYDDYGRYAKLSYVNNFLICICDLNNHSLFYTYDTNGCIRTGEDDNGTIYFTNLYDESGRVVTQHDSDRLHPTTFGYTEIEETEQSSSNSENSVEEDEDKKVKYVRRTSNRNGHTSTRKYNSKGLLIEYTDENGDIKTYEYDENNNITKETDALGYSIETSYNNFNKPVTVKDKNNNTTTYQYDENGNVEKITYANGGVEEFKYNERNQITEHTDLRGALTVYTYDDNGMPKSKKVCCKEAIEYVYENGLLKSEKNARNFVTTYHHDALGRMDYKTDPKGNKTYYYYDYFGNITRITDAENNTIRYKYDCNYQKIEETDAKGNTTKYTYNGNLKLTSITTPDEYTEEREYDSEDRLILTRDKECRETKKTYDKAGRLKSVCYPDSSTVTYDYIYMQPEETEQSEEMEKLIYVIRETSPTGAITEKTHDGNGNVLTVTDGNGNVTQNTYDNMNRLVETVNPMGGITVYRYSLAGDLLEKVDLLPNECEEFGQGRKTTYTYDKYGNKESVRDPRGYVSYYEYDDNNNLITFTDATGNETVYTYDQFDRVETITDAKQNYVTYYYDKIGRRTSVMDARGNTFTTEYDANGNVLNEKNANNHNLYSKIYNEMNLPIEVTDAAGKVTRYTYTPLGKVEKVTDPLNNEKIYSYNSRGLNYQVIDEKDGYSRAWYNSLGEIEELVGPTNVITEYTYDETGRLLSESTPVPNKAKSYEYNELNLKSKITNARGQKHTLTYNELGQITKIITPEDTISYEYDNNGNIVKVTDKHGVTRRTFDPLNRVQTVTDPFGNTISYHYDSVGNLTQIVYPDNTSVTYTYDENHNLSTVTDWANRETQYDYDYNNMLTTVTRPDGSITFINYDTAYRITSTLTLSHYHSETISEFSYIYDDLGRISIETDHVTNTQTNYVYDELSRVTKRTINGVEENFSYDAAGNITSNGRVYDNKGKLTRFENTDILYDNDGNMLYGSIDGMYINFAYDSSNRLISAGDCEYTYSAEDVRIKAKCCDNETHYVYDTNAKLSKLLVKYTDGVYTKYVYGNGLIGEETCSELSCEFKTYHFDYRGSTVAITDMQGYITDRFKYDTYGKVTEHLGYSDVIFTYNGRDGVVTEPNGLYYMRARYYSPDLMRFINADILAGSISDTLTLNRYAYANCNPVSNIDPFGLEASRGDYGFGTISYNGEVYSIYVPDYTKTVIEGQWKTVGDPISVYDFNFDAIGFIAGMEIDDLDGNLNLSNPNISSNKMYKKYAYTSIFTGLINSLSNNVSDMFITYEFQKCDGKNRVIVRAGTNSTKEFYDRYANDIPTSLYFAQSSGSIGSAVISSSSKNLYKEMTGKDVGMFDTYDTEVTLDSRHKGQYHSTFLWVDADGTLMQKPILYPNDKITVGKLYGPLFLGYDSKLNLQLDHSTPASIEYQALFNKPIR